MSHETEHIRKLVEASLRGDLTAFEALVNRYKGMIFTCAYRLTGSRDLADDIGQETFVRAFEHLDRFRGESGFSSWLYQIAVNLCRDHRKRKSARMDGFLDQYVPSRYRGPDRSAEETDDARRLADALRRVPDIYREAFVLVELEGLSYAQAAEMTGVSLGALKMRVTRARGFLKGFLKERIE